MVAGLLTMQVLVTLIVCAARAGGAEQMAMNAVASKMNARTARMSDRRGGMEGEAESMTFMMEEDAGGAQRADASKQ
jgi:hypothetical protein